MQTVNEIKKFKSKSASTCIYIYIYTYVIGGFASVIRVIVEVVEMVEPDEYIRET